jgi:hypothetical protein
VGEREKDIKLPLTKERKNYEKIDIRRNSINIS